MATGPRHVMQEATRVRQEAALFATAPRWQQPRCPWADEWRNKMWPLYPVEYYSAVKRNEIVKFATTWMKLECIMLSKMSQAKRQVPYDFTYMWNLINKTNKQKGKKRDKPRNRLLKTNCY